MWIIWKNTGVKSKLARYLFWGVFLGWLGDIFLQDKDSLLFFSLGLIAFLLGHLFYIALFNSEVKSLRKTNFIMEQPFWILPFMGFWIYLLILFSPVEIDLPKAPIYLYALVINIMAIMALNRKYSATRASWILVIIGSLLFVLSDFVLAINLFFGQFPYNRLIVMSTYTAAQGLIVFGVLKNHSMNIVEKK